MPKDHFDPITPGDGLLVERLNRRIRTSELLFDGLQSTNFVSGSVGFQILETGVAQFNSGLSLGASLTGDLIMAGGKIMTADTGNVRMELRADALEQFAFFNASDDSLFFMYPGTGVIVLDAADSISAAPSGFQFRGSAHDFYTNNLLTVDIQNDGDVELNRGSLEFGTEDEGIDSADGTRLIQFNNIGPARTKVTTLFPNEEVSNPANITSFTTASTYITITTITLHTHSEDTPVAVDADCFATWGEAGAVAYLNNIKMGISLDGGSTWTDSDVSETYIGTGAGGTGFRDNVSIPQYLEGTATGDVQVRMQYQLADTATDRLNNITLRGRVEQTF